MLLASTTFLITDLSLRLIGLGVSGSIGVLNVSLYDWVRNNKLTSLRLILLMISAWVGSSPADSSAEDDCSPDSAASALAGASVCYIVSALPHNELPSTHLASPDALHDFLLAWLISRLAAG
jgi:hypothetical protein